MQQVDFGCKVRFGCRDVQLSVVCILMMNSKRMQDSGTVVQYKVRTAVVLAMSLVALQTQQLMYMRKSHATRQVHEKKLHHRTNKYLECRYDDNQPSA